MHIAALNLIEFAGIIAGLLLLRLAPALQAAPSPKREPSEVSVIIPARNEAANLPLLLESLRASAIPPAEIIVVDDDSTDHTASIAAHHGATVIRSAQLPGGWTGKTWACHRGACAATGSTLFFLDADCYFKDQGYSRAIACFASLHDDSALSILPFHRTQRWYEELSLFFNILVAIGAGGFGRLDLPHLFGPSLLIGRDLYNRAGGHESVRGEILENLHFAVKVRAAGGTAHALAGRDVLETRMFPQGFAQLRESWTKAFATGAGATSPLVLILSVLWLTAAMLAAIALATYRTPLLLALYIANAAQIAWYGRQFGAYRLLTALLYPIPLAFYFVVFAQSLLLRLRSQPVTWRGRRL